MTKFNKTTAAILGGAMAAILGAFLPLDPNVVASVEVVVVAALVWLVPNVSM